MLMGLNFTKDNSFQELKASIDSAIGQNQDNFTKTELLGRGLFESFLKDKGVTDFKFTEGKFDKVDCFLNLKKRWEVEIKVRADSAENYSTLFLEAAKLKAMIQLIKEGQAEEGLYINFIRNKLYIFNIRAVCAALQRKQIYISSRHCNRTTAVASDMVDKRMIELPKKMAAEYEFIEGRWAKVRP